MAPILLLIFFVRAHFGDRAASNDTLGAELIWSLRFLDGFLIRSTKL